MDTLDSLVEKVNKATADSPIFFLTNDAERGLGLEKLLKSYHVVCIDDNQIVDYMKKDGVKLFCLEQELQILNSIYRNSNRLLRHPRTQKYLKANMKSDRAYAMFFKIAPNIERTCESLHLSLINTTSELNRKFELKVSQYNSIKDIGLRLPKTICARLEELSFEQLTNEIGPHIVLQFNRGHTGKGTEFINSKGIFNEIQKKFPKRLVKCAEHIVGDAYTINACITKHGVCWGGLSYQITGIEELTAKVAGTVGNDWHYPVFLSKSVKKDIADQTVKAGEAMAKEGFKGMFGLDFVIDNRSNKAYLIEINARQPASIPMFTKLQLYQKQIPLNLLAIAEFLDIEYQIDVKAYNERGYQQINAAQVFLRNKYKKKARVIGGVTVGSYSLLGESQAYNWDQGKQSQKENVIFLDEDRAQPLVFNNEAYAIDGIEAAGLIVLCAREGKVIESNAEVARIQTLQSVLNKKGQLLHWIKVMVSGLSSNILLQEE